MIQNMHDPEYNIHDVHDPEHNIDDDLGVNREPKIYNNNKNTYSHFPLLNYHFYLPSV